MKVVLPEKVKITKKELYIYISVMVVCVFCVIIAVYIQFYARIGIGRLLGFDTAGEFGKKNEEQTENLVVEFDQIFTNKLEETEEPINFIAKDGDKPIVYTKVEEKESKLNSYDVEVHIPYININSEIADKYNSQIEDFINKKNSILETVDRNTIYTVEYVANVQDDILSLVIRSTLKEGSSAQRIIIQTYNYDLRNNKEVTLEEVLKIEGINISETQEKINNEIKKAQQRVEDLKALGYNIHGRNVSNDIYEIENSKEFYLTNNTLYIIYAYGNESFTTEMDIVVI